MNQINRWILALSLVASCAGLAGLPAARAQDQDDAMLRQQIRQYQQDMRRDQSQLTTLQRQRQQLVRDEGPRNQIRSLDQQISMLDRHILRDQELIRRDQHQLSGWEDQNTPPRHRRSHRTPIAEPPVHPNRGRNHHWNGDNP